MTRNEVQKGWYLHIISHSKELVLIELERVSSIMHFSWSAQPLVHLQLRDIPKSRSLPLRHYSEDQVLEP